MKHSDVLTRFEFLPLLARYSKFKSLAMQTTTVPYYSHHPGPPSNLAQPPIGTGATTSVSHAPNSSAAGVATTTGGGGGDPVALRVSVAHLLSRAYTVPCSAAALAFTQLVQPIARFQLALDVLLPLFLDSTVPVSTISLLTNNDLNSLMNVLIFLFCFIFV